MGDTLKRYEIEEKEEWRRWCKEIPFIKFPPEWEVKIIPPFGAAIARFQVKTPKCKIVSVYLDCYDRLGYFGSPYWEIYPHKEDVYRCAISEVDDLLKAISEAR